MQGLEQARQLYLQRGAQLIHERFPEYEGRIAVGLAGHGSECFGFDDELSRDHDFALGFCLWLTEEDDRRIGVELSRAYRELPIERAEKRSELAESSRGVNRIDLFFRRYTGSDGAPESWEQWLYLPSYALAEASNGQVWRDDLGEFSRQRELIRTGMPEDVRLKKLAARAALMAQAGQYNFTRCIKHGQQGAAMLALTEFVKAASDMIYLLNRAHMPYYKWAFRGMEELSVLPDMRPALEFLLLGDNEEEGLRVKAGVVEDICAAAIRELQKQGLSHGSWDYMEPHAFEITEHIQNPQIRTLHIMEG